MKTVPTNLSNLSYVLENDVVKQTVYDDLVTEADALDLSKLVKKSENDTKIEEVERKFT